MQVIMLPNWLEKIILQLAGDPAIIWAAILALLLLFSKVTGFIADHTDGFVSGLFHLLSAVLLVLIPFELFEVRDRASARMTCLRSPLMSSVCS